LPAGAPLLHIEFATGPTTTTTTATTTTTLGTTSTTAGPTTTTTGATTTTTTTTTTHPTTTTSTTLPTGVTVDRRVAASSDDAEQKGSSVQFDSSDLELIDDSGIQTVGIRFRNVTVPQGKTILHAWVQFQVDEVSSGTISLRIEGQNADNPGTFTTSSNNISSRPRTSAFQPWVPPGWPTVGAALDPQKTPDIKNVIQEIISRPLWTSGNAVVIIISGTTGKRVAESYDGTSTGAPLLHVEYAP
jgi:hypothetical protein